MLPTRFFKSSLNARRRLACSLCIGLLISVILQALPAQQTLRVDVDLVNVVLTAQDGAGRFVTGLNEGDFRIYEDGVEQKIAVFEKEDVESAIGILLDNSLSMVDILPMMKTGLLDFAEHTSSFNELFVLTFGTRVRTLHDVRQPLFAAGIQTEGAWVQGTSVLYDALVEGLRKVSSASRSERPSWCLPTASTPRVRSGFKDVLHRSAESRSPALFHSYRIAHS